MKGYLEQDGTPTPDNPAKIKTQVIGNNLFETYEVNGRTYTDNLPKNALISIPKEQYIEYEQQKEEIERLNNIINELEKDIKNLYTYGIKNNREQKDYLLNRLECLKELKGSDKE